jgi:putative transposase
MPNPQDIRHGRHCVSALNVHLVFVTKYRKGVLDASALSWLQGHFSSVCDKMECRLLACDGESDHVHLLVEYPPKLAIAALVNALKGTSSRVLRKVRPDLAKRYWHGVLWAPSYFAASAGGAPLAVLREYVEQQRASSPD